MAALSDYLENKIIDWLLRGQAFTPPATVYIAAIRATAGVSPRSTAVNVGQTTVPNTPNGRLYKCTTAGTTGSGEPAWGGTANSTTSDGSAVWTEASSDFESNSAVITSAEMTGGGYARASVASSLANWAGTQSSGSTVASSGSSATTSNNGSIAFPTPSANWGVLSAWVMYDASSGGNALTYAVLTNPKTVNNGDPAPVFSAGSLTFQIDN